MDTPAKIARGNVVDLMAVLDLNEAQAAPALRGRASKSGLSWSSRIHPRSWSARTARLRASILATLLRMGLIASRQVLSSREFLADGHVADHNCGAATGIT